VKDDFGQERMSATTREVGIAIAFAAMLGIGIWTVLLPALDHEQQPNDEAQGDSAADGTRTPAAP
jgi:hypothetical protein